MYVSVGHPDLWGHGHGYAQEMSPKDSRSHSMITIKNVVSSGGKSTCKGSETKKSRIQEH